MKHSKKRRATACLAAAVMAASAMLTGCWEPSAKQLVDSGKARMEKKDYKAAAIEFKNALQKDGSLVEARFLLGKALLESGDVQGAWLELSKARDAAYSNDELVPVMAATLILRGETDKFIAEYGDVQLSSPKRQAELKAALATAYGSRGKYVQARAAADAALQADPGNIVAQLAVAQLLHIAGDKNAALEQVERALKADPQSARPLIMKAEILQASGADPADVISTYREALKRDKASNAAHLGIIGLLMQQRDFDSVQKQLAELDKAQPNNLQVRYFSALLAMERKDLKAAHETSQQLLKALPSNSRFLHLAGAIEYERGAYLQAIAHLGKALPNSQNPVAVRVLLARAQLRAGDPRKALSFVQPLLDTDTLMPAEVYSVAADSHLQMGNADAAKKMFAKTVQVNPQDSRGRTALALAELTAGRTERAMTELKAIAAGEGAGEAEVVMVVAHIRGNRFDDAQGVIDSIDRKYPTKPVAPFFRGQIEQRLGNAVKAREQFELAVSRQPSYLPAVAALALMDQNDGKIDAAVARYEKLVAADPQSVPAALGLVSMRARAGAKPEELKSRLEAAVKRFPDADEPRVALATALLEEGEAKAALQVAVEGVTRFSDNGKLHEMVGLAELKSGNYNQALQAFNKMASLQPNAVEPLMRVSEVHLARKDVPAAIAQLRKVIAIKPDYMQAQASLMTLLSRTGKMEEALAQAKAVQTLLPNEAYGWTYEGDLQASKGNKPAAVAALRTSFTKAPVVETAMKLHRALLAANQTADADKLAFDWLAKQPNDPRFNFYLGDLAMGRKDFERAEQQYLKVIAADPRHPVALNNLAWLLQRAGKPGALEAAEKALALAPNATAFMDTAAEIHASAGQLSKALALQKRAVELDPEQPTHRLHLAQYLLKNNQKAEARVELQRLAQLGSAFAGQDEVQKLIASL
ncbi:MAG: XrtA/PEP-CTERM system TPR-repeat protein PrsT [Roseateles sp.]|uniref:XrtA/PEP-CTERM system TPR-repeat protein PrsT n=1 Tax=Roseateles sp. TaxID=1971397 RepID=UPI0040372819